MIIDGSLNIPSVIWERLDQSPVPLDARMRVTHDPGALAPKDEVDQQFEAFYAGMLGMDEKYDGPDGCYRFLKDYTDEQGEKVFRTSPEQMEVMSIVLKRMEEDGLKYTEDGVGHTDLFKFASRALTAAFQMNMTIDKMRQDTFSLDKDEDSYMYADW